MNHNKDLPTGKFFTPSKVIPNRTNIMSLNAVLIPQENVHPNTFNTNNQEESIEVIRDSLNEGFIKIFDNTDLGDNVLRQFVYALDDLDRLIYTPGCPTNRLLTSPDLINFGEEAIQALHPRRFHPSTGRSGVAVSSKVLSLVSSFLDKGFPSAINKVLKELKVPGITITLDNEPYFVGITTNTGHDQFGFLTYEDSGKMISVSIPFLLNRLEM